MANNQHYLTCPGCGEEVDRRGFDRSKGGPYSERIGEREYQYWHGRCRSRHDAYSGPFGETVRVGCAACEDGTCPGRERLPHPYQDEIGERQWYEFLSGPCPVCLKGEHEDNCNEDYHYTCGTSYNCEGFGWSIRCEEALGG